MDRKTIELIAIGASAAANCRPCMEYHFEMGRKAGISEEQLRQALAVGIKVNQGAGRKTVEYIDERFGGQEEDAPANPGRACCG